MQGVVVTTAQVRLSDPVSGRTGWVGRLWGCRTPDGCGAVVPACIQAAWWKQLARPENKAGCRQGVASQVCCSWRRGCQWRSVPVPRCFVEGCLLQAHAACTGCVCRCCLLASGAVCICLYMTRLGSLLLLGWAVPFNSVFDASPCLGLSSSISFGQGPATRPKWVLCSARLLAVHACDTAVTAHHTATQQEACATCTL